MKNYIGTLVLLIGAGVLIYAGFNQAHDSNMLLGLGLLAVVLGFILHIVINRSSKAIED